MTTAEPRVGKKLRFHFGKNWQRFLTVLDERRIAESEKCLTQMLEAEDLRGKTFLDIGAGSGLSSLAARRLGARVHSFDYDPECVACAEYLKQRFFPNDRDWVIEKGSVLDSAWLKSLKEYDIVYSWGVLHHTGAMWQALENIDPLVSRGGTLFVAIYNDQGKASDFWRGIKRIYNELPRGLRSVITLPTLVYIWGPATVKDFLRLTPFHTWQTYRKSRGMSPWRDLVDWVGGYPFEVSSPQAILDFYVNRGYQLKRLKTCGRGRGCNEFVFTKL